MAFAGSPNADGQATSAQTSAQKPDVLQQTSGTTLAPATEDNSSIAGAITEDEIRQLLVSKTLYLRNGYLDNSLDFDERGRLIGQSQQGSYTLCLVQIDKVHLGKRKLELSGIRYGLHFLGALPNEDPTKAVDSVRITPKKKVLKITIDRELVVVPKKKKAKNADRARAITTTPDAPMLLASTSSDVKVPSAAPVEDVPGPVGTVTTTTLPAHSARLLREALDTVFSQGLDDRFIASLPSFWKLYFEAAAQQKDFHPADPSIYRQNSVDQPARLLTPLEPSSNEYAQENGVAGMALYHTIVGTDGKAEQIVVARPIGFGLDESAANTIRKADFKPAVKDGKTVPVMVDLVVEFRIYSKRTSEPGAPNEGANAGPVLPGPYSVNNQ
jgi:outer membrane biosynthesis protein TonB